MVGGWIICREGVSTTCVSGWVVSDEAHDPPAYAGGTDPQGSTKLRKRTTLTIDDMINAQFKAALGPQVSVTALVAHGLCEFVQLPLFLIFLAA